VNLAGSSPREAEGPTILVAEDHRDSRDALRTLLPDLILMDIMMPRLDGLAATKLLRADPDFSSTPILALTAMDGAREAVMEAGCDDYLRKPIDVASFFEAVHRWVRTGRAKADGK
jgi:CheY-like chemotaxis protein